MTDPATLEYGRQAAAAARAAMATQLNRVYAAVDHMSELEGQSRSLIIEMSQAMLNDVIEGRGLAPMVDYVKHYCDVIDSAADAALIAADI
jgi:hypothetical protein